VNNIIDLNNETGLVVVADRDHERVALFHVIFDGEIIAANKSWRNVFAVVTEHTGNVEATERILRAALYEFDCDKSDTGEYVDSERDDLPFGVGFNPHDAEALFSVMAHAAGSVPSGWCRVCHEARQHEIAAMEADILRATFDEVDWR
jgi:hypothetical protein